MYCCSCPKGLCFIDQYGLADVVLDIITINDDVMFVFVIVIEIVLSFIRDALIDDVLKVVFRFVLKVVLDVVHD